MMVSLYILMVTSMTMAVFWDVDDDDDDGGSKLY
jgi:hypothetical protein